MPLLWHNFVPPNSIGPRQGKHFCAPWESLQSLGEEVRLTALNDSGLTPGLDPVCLFSRVSGTSRNSLCISAPDPSSHCPTWLLLGELLVVHLMSSISKSLLLAQSRCAAWSTIYSPKRHHPVSPKTNDETPCLCSYLKSTKKSNAFTCGAQHCGLRNSNEAVTPSPCWTSSCAKSTDWGTSLPGFNPGLAVCYLSGPG